MSPWSPQVCDSFSLSLFLMTLTVLRNLDQMFWKMAPYWALLMFFSGWEGFWAGDQRGEVPVSSYHIQGTEYQHDWPGLMLTTTWLKQCLSRLFTTMLFVLPHFAYSNLLREVIMCISASKGGEVMLDLVKGRNNYIILGLQNNLLKYVLQLHELSTQIKIFQTPWNQNKIQKISWMLRPIRWQLSSKTSRVNFCFYQNSILFSLMGL